MHELGLVISVAEIVERYAEENNVPQVAKVVLPVGEGFLTVPHLMKAAYKSAVCGTILENSELEINLIAASAKCRKCGSTFNPLRSDGVCPKCLGEDYEVLSGKEFR